MGQTDTFLSRHLLTQGWNAGSSFPSGFCNLTVLLASTRHMDTPLRATSGGSAGTNLIRFGAQDLDEHCLVRAQTLHGHLQLPGIILTGPVQKGQCCLLEVSTQITLEHLCQVL